MPAPGPATPDAPLAAGESATNKTPYDPRTIKVSIREAPLAHRNNENAITMEIAVRNRDGKPMCAKYAVFLTFNRPGGAPEDLPAGCQDQHFNDPETSRGSYHCTALIEGPGDWQFTATVNNPALRNQQLLSTISTTKNFPNAIETGNEDEGLPYVLEASTFDVFLLQFHVAMAGLWTLLAGIMAFLAIPRLRRTLSVLSVHMLEVRRGFLISSLWGTFGGTLATGLYLLGTETAYKAPFSTKQFSFSAWDKIANLPYAQTYFLLLYAEILVFGVMAVVSVVLMMEASRRAQLAQDSDSLERDDDDMWAKGVHFDEEGHVLHDDDLAVVGGATASVTRTAVRAQRRASPAAGVSPRMLWMCVLVLLAGSMGIGGAVTGLKYLHELIEMAAAAATVRSGG